jgi:PhnB protein
MDKENSKRSCDDNNVQATQKESYEKVLVPKEKKKNSSKEAVKSPLLVPYLIFDGTCEEAFYLYKSLFDGEFTQFSRYKDVPEINNHPIPESELGKIMHVSLAIKGEVILMGSDRLKEFWEATVAGNISSIFLTAYSYSEADKLFNGLSAGGTIKMPLTQTFLGLYMGMLEDKFGVHWILCFEKK